jgi:hypothetical protein
MPAPPSFARLDARVLVQSQRRITPRASEVPVLAHDIEFANAFAAAMSFGPLAQESIHPH